MYLDEQPNGQEAEKRKFNHIFQEAYWARKNTDMVFSIWLSSGWENNDSEAFEYEYYHSAFRWEQAIWLLNFHSNWTGVGKVSYLF